MTKSLSIENSQTREKQTTCEKNQNCDVNRGIVKHSKEKQYESFEEAKMRTSPELDGIFSKTTLLEEIRYTVKTDEPYLSAIFMQKCCQLLLLLWFNINNSFMLFVYNFV